MNSNEMDGNVRTISETAKDTAGRFADSAGRQANSAFDHLAEAAQARFGDTVAKVSGQISEGAREVSRRAADLVDGAKQGRDAIIETTETLGVTARRAVQDSPVWSILGAVAFGFVAAYLLRAPRAGDGGRRGS